MDDRTIEIGNHALWAVFADLVSGAHSHAVSGYVSGLDAEAFAKDLKTVDACAFRIARMSQDFSPAIPDADVPGLAEPLAKLARTAAKISSDYASVRAEDIWEAVTETVPEISRLARAAAESAKGSLENSFPSVSWLPPSTGFFRGTDPEWLAAFLSGNRPDPLNLADSYGFASEYGTVVCEFETVRSAKVRTEDVRSRKDDVSWYDPELSADPDLDGIVWGIGRGGSHFRMKPGVLKLVRVHFQAPLRESFGEMVAANRKCAGLTRESFAKDTGTTASEIAEYERFERDPELGAVRKFAAFLPVEQVLRAEWISVAIPPPDGPS